MVFADAVTEKSAASPAASITVTLLSSAWLELITSTPLRPPPVITEISDRVKSVTVKL